MAIPMKKGAASEMAPVINPQTRSKLKRAKMSDHCEGDESAGFLDNFSEQLFISEEFF